MPSPTLDWYSKSPWSSLLVAFASPTTSGFRKKGSSPSCSGVTPSVTTPLNGVSTLGCPGSSWALFVNPPECHRYHLRVHRQNTEDNTDGSAHIQITDNTLANGRCLSSSCLGCSFKGRHPYKVHSGLTKAIHYHSLLVTDVHFTLCQKAQNRPQPFCQ